MAFPFSLLFLTSLPFSLPFPPLSIFSDQIFVGVWGNRLSNPKTPKQLWRQGIPSSVRGRVWLTAIGNSLQITRELFEKLISPDSVKHSKNLSVILVDVPRTFPNLGVFHKKGAYYDSMIKVLIALDLFLPDIGYVQGMSYIAALFVIHLSPFHAFVCLANLINRPFFTGQFTMDMEFVRLPSPSLFSLPLLPSPPSFPSFLPFPSVLHSFTLSLHSLFRSHFLVAYHSLSSLLAYFWRSEFKHSLPLSFPFPFQSLIYESLGFAPFPCPFANLIIISSSPF